MAEPELRATPEDRQIAQLEQELAVALKEHEDAVVRVADVPGVGTDSAQQIIAEVGPQAARFPTAADMCSWVGTCPGQEGSAATRPDSGSSTGRLTGVSFSSDR
jgi:transposase